MKLGIISAFAAALLIAVTATADPSFDLVTWGTAGDTLGWTRTGDGTVSAPSGYLEMAFAAVVGPPTFQSGTMYSTGTNYVGNYAQYENFAVNFSFLGYPASAQALYLESTGGSTWAYDFTSSGAWETKQIGLTGATSGWTLLSGGESFATALQHISLIGIAVEHLNLGSAKYYGLDNWQYTNYAPVPEPGTVAMALTVFLSVGIAFQKRIRQFAGARLTT